MIEIQLSDEQTARLATSPEKILILDSNGVQLAKVDSFVYGALLKHRAREADTQRKKVPAAKVHGHLDELQKLRESKGKLSKEEVLETLRTLRAKDSQ